MQGHNQQNVRETLLDADRDARARAVALESRGKLPAGFVDRHYGLTPREQVELRRLKACGAAATDVDVFVALCKGEAVPAFRLRQQIISRHRRRIGA